MGRVWVAMAFVLSAQAALAGELAVWVAPRVPSPSQTAALEPLMAELARRGVDVESSALAAALRREFAVRASVLSSDDRRRFLAGIEAGYQAWIGGEIEDAEQALRDSLTLAEADAVTLAGDAQMRRGLFRGYVILALVRDRRGDAKEAERLMADIAARFPDSAFDRRSFGPRAAELFDRGHRLTAAAAVATLVIRADPDAGVYLDGRFVGVGGASAKVQVGSRRVEVREGDGRVWTVAVTVPAAGATTDLRSTRPRWVSGSWTGIVAPPEARLGGPLGRAAASVGAQAIIVARQEADTVRVTRYRPSGQVIRAASRRVSASTPAAELSRLAAHVLGDGPGPATKRSTTGPYVVIGVGTAAVLTGVALLILDGRENCEDGVSTCPDVYETAGAGWIIGGVGVAAAAGGLAWRFWPRSSAVAGLSFGAATGPGLAVSGRF